MKTWGKIDICGHRYKVILVEEGALGEVEQDGECNFEAGTITLRSRPDHPTRVLDSFFHEVCHACFEGNGLQTYLRSVLRNRRQVDQVEEQIIRMLVPALVPALRSAGLLSRKVLK